MNPWVGVGMDDDERKVLDAIRAPDIYVDTMTGRSPKLATQQPAPHRANNAVGN